MNVEKGPSCGTWIHGLTKLSEPARQTPIMIVIIKTLFLGSSLVRLFPEPVETGR